MNKLYPRWQKKIISEGLNTRRVLLLCGPRQCGKTTLAKAIHPEQALYLTLDNLATKELAERDPHGFVQHQNKMLIIDEIQHVPSLLSAIKLIVDENTKPGQFLLTGSTNIQSLPSVQESLAGRIRKIRLRPLAQGELLGIKPRFIEQAFAQELPRITQNPYNRNTLLTMAFRGGYPEAITLKNADRRQWHADYIEALLTRDLIEIARITHHHAMHELITILAAWSGKFMDITALGSGLSIRRPTLESYINALEALYLIERIPPWLRTDYERVGKQSKLYMTDSGLMASVLRWNFEQVEWDPDRSGKLIETFIFNEIAAQIDADHGKYQLFHYRDREKREIDLLIERDDQALIGIEIKAGSSISASDFKHLTWFKNHIAKNRPFHGIVLYTGELLGSMGDNLWAVPINALWS